MTLVAMTRVFPPHPDLLSDSAVVTVTARLGIGYNSVSL